MKKAHWTWKAAAVLLCLVAASELLAMLFGRAASSGQWAGSLGLALASVGVVQYAFGAPRLPAIVWRIFGPLFSTVMIWPLASSIGWLGTRLAIKSLTAAEQASTAGLLLLLAIFGIVIVVPLYRLGEWRELSREADERLSELSDTFA